MSFCVRLEESPMLTTGCTVNWRDSFWKSSSTSLSNLFPFCQSKSTVVGSFVSTGVQKMSPRPTTVELPNLMRHGPWTCGA
jgi:hypothetical protein